MFPALPSVKPFRISSRKRYSRLDMAPYSCNFCRQQINRYTVAHKYTHNVFFADCKYREKLCSSRPDISATKPETRKKTRIIFPLSKQEYSPHHILTNHPELIHICTDHILLSRPVLLIARNY